MDYNKLRALVFEKTGMKIDEQDPVFALVALNDAVLEETVARHVAAINDAGDRIKAQTRFLMEAGERYRKLHAGEALSAQNAASFEAWARENPSAQPQSVLQQAAPPAAPGKGRLLGLVVVASLLSGLLVAGGQWLMAREMPARAQVPAPPPTPAQLTPAQAEMIRLGEKFSRAMLNLDENTRAQIQAEMDKP